MAMGVMKPAVFTALLTSVVLVAACSAVTTLGVGHVTGGGGGGDGVQGLAGAYVFAMYAQAGTLVLVSWRLKVSQCSVCLSACLSVCLSAPLLAPYSLLLISCE